MQQVGVPTTRPNKQPAQHKSKSQRPRQMERAPTCPRRRAQAQGNRLPPSLSACLREASLPPSSGQASPATTSLCRPGQPRTAPLRPRLRKAGAAAGLPRGPCPPQTGEGGPRGAAAGRVRCKGWRRLTASRRVAPLPLLPFDASSFPRPLPASRRARGRGGHDFIFSPLSEMSTFAAAGVSSGST